MSPRKYVKQMAKKTGDPLGELNVQDLWMNCCILFPFAIVVSTVLFLYPTPAGSARYATTLGGEINRRWGKGSNASTPTGSSGSGGGGGYRGGSRPETSGRGGGGGGGGGGRGEESNHRDEAPPPSPASRNSYGGGGVGVRVHEERQHANAPPPPPSRADEHYQSYHAQSSSRGPPPVPLPPTKVRSLQY